MIEIYRHSRHRPRILIAGTHSGVGKTSITLGILHRLRQMGLTVQPFKVGPDFIDPSLHTSVGKRISRNLDSFLNMPETNQEIFWRATQGADVSVIEGVMGLFDGYSGIDERGSSAHMAKVLNTPVILVVNASHACRSIAALIQGYASYDKKLTIAGVILNKVASQTHLKWLKEALSETVHIPLVGYVFNDQKLRMPERHLGLAPSAETPVQKIWLQRLDLQLKEQFDWTRLLKIARSATSLSRPSKRIFPDPVPPRVAIAIAKDPAFCFYYQENLELLELFGAEILPFSPMSDSTLPKRAAGLYLGGGYPELWGKELTANRALRAEIDKKIQSRFPVLAECGGLMYLGSSIKDFEGHAHTMVGALPYRTKMTRQIKLAYVDVITQKVNLLCEPRSRFPAQYFHFSDLESRSPLNYSYRLYDGSKTYPDGISYKNALASYIHVHFASRPGMAQQFVGKAVAWKANH